MSYTYGIYGIVNSIFKMDLLWWKNISQYFSSLFKSRMRNKMTLISLYENKDFEDRFNRRENVGYTGVKFTHALSKTKKDKTPIYPERFSPEKSSLGFEVRMFGYPFLLASEFVEMINNSGKLPGEKISSIEGWSEFRDEPRPLESNRECPYHGNMKEVLYFTDSY